MNKRDIRIWFVSLFIVAILAPSYFAQDSFCASRANPDPDCTRADKFAQHAIWLPFLEDGSVAFEGDAFVFDGACSGMFVEVSQRFAVLTGTVISASDPNKGFEVDIQFSRRTAHLLMVVQNLNVTVSKISRIGITIEAYRVA